MEEYRGLYYTHEPNSKVLTIYEDFGKGPEYSAQLYYDSRLVELKSLLDAFLDGVLVLPYPVGYSALEVRRARAIKRLGGTTEDIKEIR